ncbi:MAG: CvpA family protein [Bacilli bacterium]
MKRNKIILVLLMILLSIILYYFMLPPINLTAPTFWSYIFLLGFIYIMLLIPLTMKDNIKNRTFNIKPIKGIKWILGIVISIIGIMFIITFLSTPLFNAKKYAKRITVDETRKFSEDVLPVDFTKIPLLDKASSQKLGDRKMGQATDWVSQFNVSSLYTQINYNDQIVRITPIEYDGLIKYFTNRKDGIKGYITVNSVNGEAKLVTLDKGMKYMPSAYFFENLYRKLRIKYPTTIFEQANFEVDNEGNPYWIIPTVKYTAIGLKKEITGVIIFNPITGESVKKKVGEVPTWIDHVYPAELIIEQLNQWGEYKNGFLNSIFGQKNVINTTKGYTYLVLDDDVFLYTGITSVSGDESNLGFVMVNLRTKETRYYAAPGAEEYSAMASAEGLVQEKEYDASFPLLINLNNKPTYLLSLKDNAGLVKMYAFIDVTDYQKVVVSDASLGIEAAAKKYLGDITDYDENNLLKKDITIKSITGAVIDSNTYYYFTDIDNNFYMASIKIDKNVLPFIKVGDKVKITYSVSTINQVATIEK